VHAEQAKRIMHTELPPRRFWWWCCGGLKVYDALIVTGCLIVNVLYVEQRYKLYMAGLKRALPPPMRPYYILLSCEAAAGWPTRF
jgi:hypothetical protein